MQGGAAQGPSSSFPGFDGLRLLAAVSVLFSHAFLIAEGTEAREPLYALLGRANIVGLYGVFVFFIISGFLLTRSLTERPDLVQFSINRFLRIVPGFVFCVAATSVVIGPLVTPLDLRAYFAQPEVYQYIGSSLMCLCDSWENPFLFAADPKLVGVKNGSLWSLSYEVLSYVFLLWLWALLGRPVLVAAAIGAVAVATVLSPSVNRVVPGVAYTLPYFAAGVLMQVVHARFGTTKLGALASAGVLLASAFVGLQHYAFAAFGAYLVVFLAERPNAGSRFARRYGDLSYGLYLFGWPVEQLTQQVTGLRDGWQLFAASLPLVFACAAVSWWAVERPFLRLKGLIRHVSARATGWRAPSPRP